MRGRKWASFCLGPVKHIDYAIFIMEQTLFSFDDMNSVR